MSNNPTVRCPVCKATGKWFEAEFGPFCSQRCKMVDLGKWLEEEHVIAEPLRPDMFDGFDELPPGEYLDQPDDSALG